jgi:hypothetical protein
MQFTEQANILMTLLIDQAPLLFKQVRFWIFLSLARDFVIIVILFYLFL